jgi:hypothetical protein
MKADIIQMAADAGWTMGHETDHLDDPFFIRLERFAQIVIRLERFAQVVANRCAEIADTAEPYKSADLIKKHFGVEE